MSSVTSLHILLATALLTSALFVSGCSSSGDSPSPADAEPDGTDELTHLLMMAQQTIQQAKQ